MAESLLCSRKKFSGKTLLPCGNHFYVSVRLRPKALCCRAVRPYINKYLFMITSGVGGQDQQNFCLQGGQAGGQNKFEQKSRGSRQTITFFSSLFRIIFFGWGGRWVQRIYYFTFIILIVLQKASSDLIYFGAVGGGAGRSKGYFYLFWLSFKKYIGYIWFQLFLGGGGEVRCRSKEY